MEREMNMAVYREIERERLISYDLLYKLLQLQHKNNKYFNYSNRKENKMMEELLICCEKDVFVCK